jgi:hypothetical protein
MTIHIRTLWPGNLACSATVAWATIGAVCKALRRFNEQVQHS